MICSMFDDALFITINDDQKEVHKACASELPDRESTDNEDEIEESIQDED